MEIYLLRHGMSLTNEQQLVCSSSDYPLSINEKMLHHEHRRLLQTEGGSH